MDTSYIMLSEEGHVARSQGEVKGHGVRSQGEVNKVMV